LVVAGPASPAQAVAAAPIWLASSTGGLFAIGGAPYHGAMSGGYRPTIIGIAGKHSGRGYWLTDFAGEVFPFGDAVRYGDLHGKHLNKPIVGMAQTPSGNGYWLVASDGGIFTFGDARYHGSLGSLKLKKPITGMVPTPDGGGYWMVATDGGIFTLGNAHFYGSLGATRLSSPIAAMATTSNGGGYWLLQRDGHVWHFGNAPGRGDAPGNGVSVGIVPTPTSNGYWIAHSNGAVKALGDAAAETMPAVHLNGPLIGLATNYASSSGYAITLLDQLFATPPPPPTQYWVGPHQIALTFDDGPSTNTKAIVDTLVAYHAPSTFFTVGYEVAGRPDLVRYEYSHGMSVQNHSWDHPDLTRRSVDQIRTEIVSAANAIHAAIGKSPTCFREPYGSTNSTVRSVISSLHLTEILWNVNPSDYERPGVAAIESRIISQADGRGLVVGIHDGGGDRSETLAALPTVINTLRSRGYTFVKLCADV
jgi:peptidoglycan/xylan/chitin deacetylase (PgdA/CDA1 family)